MFDDTFLGIALLTIGLVPGALYFWAFERQVGRWGIGLSDRALRFLGASALFHVLMAPVTYWLWATQWPRARDGEPLSLWLWGLAFVYLAIPLVAGSAIGLATHRGYWWSRWVAGPHPAPRAWDYLFERQSDGWIRLRLKSGVWIGGVFAVVNGRMPYSAGYPDPQDLYLAAAIDVDPETGEFPLDEDGNIQHRPGGLLVRWDEVEYLEFIDA